MPLSKKRDKERKRVERAKLRLDKLLLPPQEKNPVQPSTSTTKVMANTAWQPEYDADGYPLYEE